MEESNGFATGSNKARRANGKSSPPMPSLNGKSKDVKANGHSTVAAAAPASVAKGKAGRGRLVLIARLLISTISRLLTWYAIVTLIWRCPADLASCDESSPMICKPYFQAKQAVAPYAAPYYEQYAVPYVEAARPYYETVDAHVLTPTYAFASKYAAPRVARVRDLGAERWDKDVRPRIDKYLENAWQSYEGSVAPHVRKASDAVRPYVDVVLGNSLRAYRGGILPAYAFVEPHVLYGYGRAADFSADTLVPTISRACAGVRTFVDATVWPRVKALYTVNVEPQLVRIGERLGRHKNERAKSAPPIANSADATDASTPDKPSDAAAASEPASSPSTTGSSIAEPKTASENPEPAAASPTASPTKESLKSPPRDYDDDFRNDPRPVREIVADDLQKWESKYTQAAEEGVAIIVERIDEISDRMIEQQVNATGHALLAELQRSADTEIGALEEEIAGIVRSLDGAADVERGRELVGAAARKAGLAVKESAQRIRAWRSKFDQDLQATINKAAHSHVQILEEIRDLALQKIGMKWAWMDGVTYKDWQNFHELRNRLTGWTEEVKNLLVTHPGIEDAQNAAADVEEAAMDIAQQTARELATLKQVGLWKVVAGDASPNFDPQQMEAAALAREGGQEDGAREAIDREANGEEANGQEIDGQEANGREVNGREAGVREINAARDAGEGRGGSNESRDEANAVKEEAHGVREDADAGESTEDANAPDDAVETVTSDETATVIVQLGQASGSQKGSKETPTPHDTENLGEMASSAIIGSGPFMGGNTSGTDDDEEAPREAPHDLRRAQEPAKPVFMGAAAQVVPGRVGPILEDDKDGDGKDVLAGVTDKARDAYSSAVAQASAQYSTAMSVVSAQIYGTPKPVHEQLFAGVSSGYSAALASASAQLGDALEAASKGIYGSPTTTARSLLPTNFDWSRVEAIASERLNDGRVWAELQYSSAKIALGLATPTPTAPVDRLLEQARHNYYAGLGVAHARYNEFLAAASAAVGSAAAAPTPTNLAGTASSLASVASESIAAAAAAAGEGAAAVASGVGSVVAEADGTVSSLIADVEQQAAAAGMAIAENWDTVVSRISAQVYGDPTPLPWYGHAFEGLLPYAADTTDKVGDGVAAVTGAAESYGAVATAEAQRQYAAVSSLVSELVVGKEPTFQESVLSRMNQAYATAAAKVDHVASEVREAFAQGSQEGKGEKDEL